MVAYRGSENPPAKINGPGRIVHDIYDSADLGLSVSWCGSWLCHSCKQLVQLSLQGG